MCERTLVVEALPSRGIFVIASEARQSSSTAQTGLLRRYAPRNDEWLASSSAPGRAVSQHRAILPRRGAEGVLVAAAEMAEIGKAAGERDLRDTVSGAQRIGEITAAFLQPPFPDEVADG